MTRLRRPKKTPPAGDLRGKRLLVVEDNELNMEIAEFMLKSTGAEVVPVFDGESAVKAYAQAAPGTYQAILMDLMMPVMDGYAATRAIRSSGRPDAGNHPHHCHECQRLCRGCAEMPGHRHERPHQQAAV